MSQLKIKDGTNWIPIPAGGVGVPSGGTQGRVLYKTGSADYATGWGTASDIGAMSKWTLLWTNASPTSSFAAQTVSLDLSGYDAVLIIYKMDTATGTYYSHTCPKGLTMNLVGFYNYRGRRGATMLDTGVTFGDGSGASTTGSMETNNGMCIPYQIFGIKGVVSA